MRVRALDVSRPVPRTRHPRTERAARFADRQTPHWRHRGNPAVVGMNPLDRKLCVLAFRRVCLWHDSIFDRGPTEVKGGCRGSQTGRESARSGVWTRRIMFHAHAARRTPASYCAPWDVTQRGVRRRPGRCGIRRPHTAMRVQASLPALAGSPAMMRGASCATMCTCAASDNPSARSAPSRPSMS